MKKESKPKYTAYQLLDFGGAVFQIRCTNCKTTHSEDLLHDVGVHAERLFSEGWRATANKCYCPRCAPKKLSL